MTRLWIGAGLLVLLLMIGIVTSLLMPMFHLPVAENLHLAAVYTREGDMERAAASFREAQAIWEEHRTFTASVCDHEPQDAMDALFGETEQRLLAGDYVSFGAGCAKLSVMAEDISRLHGLSLSQLL